MSSLPTREKDFTVFVYSDLILCYCFHVLQLQYGYNNTWLKISTSESVFMLIVSSFFHLSFSCSLLSCYV